MHLTGCALAAPPPIDGCPIVVETDAEKRTILLDAERRPLQARVGRLRCRLTFITALAVGRRVEELFLLLPLYHMVLRVACRSNAHPDT